MNGVRQLTIGLRRMRQTASLTQNVRCQHNLLELYFDILARLY